jgi:predicted transcriptional regulator
MTNNKMFSISFDTEMNHYTNEVESEVYLRVYKSMFTSGLVANMGIQNFATLMAIASYMNEKGECYPSQRQLAERMGVHVNSVNKYINSLLEVEVNGKPIVTRELAPRGRGRTSSFYRIQPLSQIAIFDGKVENVTKDVKPLSQDSEQTNHKSSDVSITKEEEPIKKKTSPKDFLDLFVNKYREVYNVNYNPNYGRDMNMIKKLLKTYTPEQVEQIITIGVEEYDERWKSVKYQRPTWGALSTFIANDVMTILEERKAEDKAYEQFEQTAEKRSERLNDKLSKLDQL